MATRSSDAGAGADWLASGKWSNVRGECSRPLWPVFVAVSAANVGDKLAAASPRPILAFAAAALR